MGCVDIEKSIPPVYPFIWTGYVCDTNEIKKKQI